jgi:hypothetical protein
VQLRKIRQNGNEGTGANLPAIALERLLSWEGEKLQANQVVNGTYKMAIIYST